MLLQVISFYQSEDLACCSIRDGVSEAGEVHRDPVLVSFCYERFWPHVLAVDEVAAEAIRATCYNELGAVQRASQRSIPESESFQVKGQPESPPVR